MKLYQALTAVCLSIASIQAIAVNVDTELSKDDLKELSRGNLRKGPLLLSPMDKTAQENIGSALKYMEYASPVALSSDPKFPSVLRYQVNPNANEKIEQVWLTGVKVNDLHVFFNSSNTARWKMNWSKDDEVTMKDVPTTAVSQTPAQWMFSLGTNNLSGYKVYNQSSYEFGNLYMNEEGDYILAHWATNTSSFGSFEDENWYDVYVKFNPSKAYTQHYTYLGEKKESKTIPYIEGKAIPEKTFKALLGKGMIRLVKEANPIIK